MVENIKSKRVKVRKDHVCHGCYGVIKKCDTVQMETNISEDGIYNLYFCFDCSVFEQLQCQSCRECYEFGTATEGYIKECRMGNR